MSALRLERGQGPPSRPERLLYLRGWTGSEWLSNLRTGQVTLFLPPLTLEEVELMSDMLQLVVIWHWSLLQELTTS